MGTTWSWRCDTCEEDAPDWVPERFLPVLEALAAVANEGATVPYFELRALSTDFVAEHRSPNHQIVITDEYGVTRPAPHLTRN